MGKKNDKINIIGADNGNIRTFINTGSGKGKVSIVEMSSKLGFFERLNRISSYLFLSEPLTIVIDIKNKERKSLKEGLKREDW